MEHTFSSEYVSDDYLHLNSCDRQVLYGTDVGSFRPSGRRDWHILYIHKGICFIKDDPDDSDSEYPVPSGSVIIYHPKEPQSYHFKAEIKSVSYYAHFSGTECAKLLRSLNLYDKRVYKTGTDSRIESLFSRMTEDFHMQKSFYPQICSGYLIQILSVIARNVACNGSDISPALNSIIKNVCKKMYLEYNLNRPITEYAKFCNMSVSRFTHLFTASQGVSPKEYLIKLKITKAIELLENTDLSINEISKCVGTENQNYFSRYFKKYTGISPRKYRV